MAQFLKPYETLFKKGSVDLAIAKLAFNSFENGNTELDEEVILFHLQQSTEKFLKCLLDYNSIKYNRTHDLFLLLEKIEDNSINIKIDVEELLVLNQFAVDGRYSIIPDIINDIEHLIIILVEFEIIIRLLILR